MSGRESLERPDSPEPEGGAGDALIGSVIADRYRIDELLGVGGMGAVYRAEHVLMKKPVAVKVLHREMTFMDEVVRRFEREAIAAGRIDHPNVTVATDFGKLPDGSFYLVLEYVPGRSLTRALEEDGAFTDERALFVARQIAAGLGAAHAAGIVHRDLKPDNVMLIERGGTRDFVKVLDFGIAKVETTGPSGSQLTRLGAVFGTPAYMSPEQAAGKPVDQRADLYSLGLVLYEMLAGHAAFQSEELVALLTKQLMEPPPPLPDSVGAEPRAIVHKLLEKGPELRFQSAEELLLAIDAHLGPAALLPDSTVLGVPSSRAATAEAARARTAPVVLQAAPAEWLRGGTAFLLSGPAVRMAGRKVPVRAAVLVATLVIAVLVAAMVHRGGRRGVATSPGALAAPPEISEILRRAEEGDRVAVQDLEARPSKGRTSAEWVAIGKGHSRLGEHRQALEAFEKAVTVDRTVARDAGVLHDVRVAADDEKTQRLALDLAAGGLGEGGADVLFDVWASTMERTETTALAKSLLDREEVRRNASRPLKVALELRKVTRCDEARRLVAEAAEIADERATRPLNQLSSRKGCGFLRLGDCFPCLRGDDTLEGAVKAAQQRKGPRL